MAAIKDNSSVRLFILLCCVKFVFSQGFITPPPPGIHPEEANGRLYNLYYVPSVCKDPYILAQSEFGGGGIVIKDQKVLMAKYGPYHIQGNIEIAPSGCLVIMPGVKMYFGIGFGILVNGTLIARGSYLPNQRILMTKHPNNSVAVGPNGVWPTDARLVDGNTTRDGRLDLKYNGKWRGVCTNYNNFTAIDLNVTCRHLGFVYGNFTYHSFARNGTDYMVYEKPACRGTENSLFECPGKNNIKVGARVCDGQQVIGFQCVGLRNDLAKDHWRGIEFYNATVDEVLIEQNLYYNETLSMLEYLDISYAGLDIYRADGLHHGIGTISASPYVPIMNNISISYCAYDGLNLTEIRGYIHVANSTISHNRGYGAFIQTSVGRTLINMTDIVYNWGDGVKMYMMNYTINEFNRDYPLDRSFCRTPSALYPSFPMVLHEDLIDTGGNKPVGTFCEKLYRTVPGKMITIHTIINERDPDATGKIIIRDGGVNGKVIQEYPIDNGTFPQSITTKTSEVFIRFEYNVPAKPPAGVDATKRCKQLRGCLRFLIELTTDYGPDIELRLYNATVANNTGYGVNIQDVRSKVSVNCSVISDNGYGAGLRVYQGAAEVAINNTVIERNVKCGVNITYSGGYQLFNLTTVANNRGYGVITEYLLLNRTRIELMQKIEVVRSFFVSNEWTAFRIGNYCLGGEYFFNYTYFGQNLHETIEYLSCNVSVKVNTNFSMAFNIFDGNKRHAVLMSPVMNTVGIFTNNTFRNHKLGVLRINNGYDFIENRWYKEFDVKYKIFANEFIDNTGRYVVNFRLSQPGPHHRLEFKFNRVTDNIINDPFMYLNPRSKADAVIVASSGNIEVQRNWIYNPGSVRDISTHLVDPSVLILANYNWWQTRDHGFVYQRLFDQKNRFNLAELEYYPVLKDQWLYGTYDTRDEPHHRWTFQRGSKIGGVLDGNYQTDYRIKTYIVDRDIFVMKDSILTILPGTTFEFEPSIGMVVHGRLFADGTNAPIKFTLFEEDVLPLENRTIYEMIRLVDGLNDYEGRLELNISGEVGTVCNDGWTDQNSALVCQQLGLTFNPDFGIPQQQIFGSTQPILLSRVDCDELDTDIFQCKAEKPGEFHCQHSQDVFIKCQPPTWSGLTIPAIPRYGLTEETRINHLTIEKAGLLDFVEMSYSPAFRIDYNFYSMSYITVRDCVSDGINIKYSNPFSRNLIEHVTVENNLGNGILTRSPFLQLSHMTLTNNGKAGFIYDPMFTEYEALSVRNFIYRNRTTLITQVSRVSLGNREMQFLTCPFSETEEDKTYWVEISTVSNTFKITVQILDYNPLTTIEKVTLYDAPLSNWQGAKMWSIEEDLVDFPIVSRGQYLTLKYTVRGLRSGRLAFAVISSGSEEVATMLSAIRVYNATIKNNERGIVTKHYNNPSNEKLEIFHRAKKEEISFDSVKIENSKEEAMFIPSLTKYHTNFIPTLEEMTQPEKVGAVTYIIKFSKFINNKKGVHGEHNHVDFANNVWKWNVTYLEISGCQSGGFEIELPRVNDMYERQFHEVSFTQSQVHDNYNFAFGVLGYYAVVNISNNNFFNNNCRRGLMTLSGMEKDLNFNSNRMENNYCKYVVDFDLKSHSEYSESVTGLFQYNVIINNRNNFVPQGLGTTNMPVTYAVAIQGVQNIVARRNILQNTELQYELVAGVTSLRLNNTLNVKENYWGTTDQYIIRARIFDFDDWNNFAIADYFPFLSVQNPNGDLSNDQKLEVDLDLNRLGGRIWQDLTIPARESAYIVYSDLTVMPGVKFTIQPGTEFQFYPNVGILVLGQLIASGLPYSRIKFGPVTAQNMRRAKRRALSGSIYQKTLDIGTNSKIKFGEVAIQNKGRSKRQVAGEVFGNKYQTSSDSRRNSRIKFRPTAIQNIGRSEHQVAYELFGNNYKKAFGISNKQMITENKRRSKRQVAGALSGDNYQKASDIRLIGGETKIEGFLELFNTSSKTWNIMCDTQFNEKTAEVVCRSLGLETVNVDVRFTYLYDYFVFGKPMYFLKEFWGYAYYCKGDEDNLDLCMKRINYNIKPCIFNANYTFIRCGKRNLPPPMDYWGNIRFARSDYEEEILPFIKDQDRSRLQYVDIDGAGMLHGEKVGAVQTTYVSPIMNNINITRCVWNGLDVVAPRHGIDIKDQNISSNLGHAVNILVLNGDSTTSTISSFTPLITNTVPYNLYGLVDICRREKEIVLENRLILFYKYSQTSVDCVKIIRGLSTVGPKRVALRFLQFSLFHDDFYRNLIEIFDGKQITPTNMLIQLTANSSELDIKTKYMSTNNYLTVHMHASPSYGFLGFIAEVVTIPLSGLTYPDDTIFHTIKNSIFKGNENGAILYKNVGEITPSIIVDHCWIEGNGIAILNLTSWPIIDMGLQSTKVFNLQNSFISRNKGGTYISATTPSAATKLNANITNNVIAYNTHGEVLNITGHHYERFRIYENYIYNNTAGDYRDSIFVQNVIVNFTFNTITNNTGHYIIRLYNTELTEATQEYTKNLFHKNNATALYRALIHVGSGNPKINHNYMVNDECDFELEANPIHMLPNGQPAQSVPIDATNNWWGSESTGYVNGKIWDKLDNGSLVPVSFMPIKINNQSLIYGKCAPGWYLEGERCYKYMGAALPYKEANQFCKENDGFLADSKNKLEFLKYLLRLTMNVYDEAMRVWVYSEVTSGRCSAFERNYVVEEYDCFNVLHPFICEKDPYISPPGSSIYAAVIGIAAGVFGVAVIIIVILACLWLAKSKKRKQERFERQESIRSSIKGSTIRSRSQMSLSSSKFLYDDRSLAASQVSLGGVTEDETTTDPREARRKLRERAENAQGRSEGDSPRSGRHEFKNGFAGPRRGREYSEDESPSSSRNEFKNGYTGGRRGREYSEDESPTSSRHDLKNRYAGGRRGREYSEEISDNEKPIARGRPDMRPPPMPRDHTNGGYKNSDESHDQTEQESDDDVKKPLTDSEEDEHRNSFTPVKFKPGVEKELDSIQMNANGSIAFRRQDESGSVDLNGRNVSRQMSSFSAHDAQNGLDNAPNPPSPLPMNIPTRPTVPSKPQPKPVPVPRPRQTPSDRSVDSKENIGEMKMNNLSGDELSDYRGSREKLDQPFGGGRVPSRENLNEPYNKYKRSDSYKRSKEDLTDTGLGVGVDLMPRFNKPPSGVDMSDRDSPLHTSRENLLPKRKNSEEYKPSPRNDQVHRSRENLYKPYFYGNQSNPSRDRMYPSDSTDPGVDYMGRKTPQNTDYSGNSGVDYLPRDTRTPMKSRFMMGQPPQSPSQPSNTGNQQGITSYQPAYNDFSAGYQPNSYQSGNQQVPYQPRYPSSSDQSGNHYEPYQPQFPTSSDNVPYQPPTNFGVDFLPRNNYPAPAGSHDYMPRSVDNFSRSQENFPPPPESLDNMSRSRENMSRSRENLSRSRENLSRSREYLRNENDFSLSQRSYDDELLENSRDVVKPGQQKSIETEI